MFKRLTKTTISPPRWGWLLGAVVALAWAAPAAADVDPASISSADAEVILETAQATVAPADAAPGAEPAADATIALRDLSLAYPELRGGDRGQARDLLARPTDGSGDPLNDGYPSGAAKLISHAESDHFCVFWVNAPQGTFPDAPNLTDANGVEDTDGVPDFVESVLEVAEYSFSVEVAPGPMGWTAPKPDRTGCGSDPSARTDIYLKELGSQGLFGYESVDPGQGRARSQYGYLVLDNDYAKSQYGYDDPTIPLSVTAAHEYNHLLQMAYDAFADVWFLESTATWSEEQVYPDVNDWLGFVDSFARFPSAPITKTYPASDDRSLRIYGAATWNHWLDVGGGGYGTTAIRRAWELSDSVKPADLAVAAYDRAIARSGGAGFSREFVPFAAATAEWRAGAAGDLPDHDAYPDVARRGSLAAGGTRRLRLDHTAYRLIDVRPPASGGLTLRVRLEDGVRGGLALVGRDGDVLTGAVTRRVRFLNAGGTGSVTLDDAAGFDRITAVVVNADGRVRGYSARARDWVYSKDDSPFKVRLAG